MIRNLIAAALTLLATPVHATDYKVVGADPTPHYSVCADDTLTLGAPLGRELRPDGSRDKTFPVWIDRAGRPVARGFAVDGATKLRLVSAGQVGTWVYAPMDTKSCAPVAVKPTPPVAVPSSLPAAGGTLYGINVSGGEFANMDNGQFLPTPADLDAYYAVGYRMFRIPLKFVQFDNSAPKLIALANECIKLATPCVFENHSYAWPAPAVKIAQVVKADSVLPKSTIIHYGLQNEPNFKDWDQWAKDAQAIVTGVRAAGVTRFMWLDYPGSSGCAALRQG